MGLSGPAAAQALSLEECRISAGPGYPGIKARCGTMLRPENPADPDSAEIEVRVAVGVFAKVLVPKWAGARDLPGATAEGDLARPVPKDNQRRALFGWLTDKPVEKWAPATETAASTDRRCGAASHRFRASAWWSPQRPPTPMA